MKIPSPVLKRSLAQLGFVTLTVGGLSTPALAHFSPIDQPLASDFFVGVEVDSAFEASSLIDVTKAASGVLTKTLLVGKNLYQENDLTSGVFGGLKGVGEGVLGKTKTAFIGAYLAHQDEATGLRLGASLTYERDCLGQETTPVVETTPTAPANEETPAEEPEEPAVEEPETDSTPEPEASASEAPAEEPAPVEEPAAEEEESDTTTKVDQNQTPPQEQTPAEETPAPATTKTPTAHRIIGRLTESYTLPLGEVSGLPLSLTQFAEVSANKSLAEGSTTELAVQGGLKLSSNLNGFSPFLSVSGGKTFKDDAKFNFAYGAGLAWQATNNVALNIKVSKVFGKDSAQAGLGLNLLF